MKRIIVAIAVALLATGPAVASDMTDVMAPIKQFLDGFNKGDPKMAIAACADQTSIIDEFAPHEWHGPGACAKWLDDFVADTKKNGVTDGHVTFGKPRHVDITADRAYVVIPTTFAFKLKGKPTKESGATITLALQKVDAGWRITGWAWTKGQ